MRNATGMPDAGSPSPVSSPSANLRRRRFLLSLTASGAGAAAASVASVAAVAAVTAPAPDSAPASSGYRETEHVRDYYRSARI